MTTKRNKITAVAGMYGLIGTLMSDSMFGSKEITKNMDSNQQSKEDIKQEFMSVKQINRNVPKLPKPVKRPKYFENVYLFQFKSVSGVFDYVVINAKSIGNANKTFNQLLRTVYGTVTDLETIYFKDMYAYFEYVIPHIDKYALPSESSDNP